MDADEREIYYFLKSFKDTFVSSREVCKRAGGKKRFRNEPKWAIAPLQRMVDRGILMTDPGGHYCIKPKPEKGGPRKWVSPEIRVILRDSRKKFEGVIEIDEDELDAYYESL